MREERKEWLFFNGNGPSFIPHRGLPFPGYTSKRLPKNISPWFLRYSFEDVLDKTFIVGVFGDAAHFCRRRSF